MKIPCFHLAGVLVLFLALAGAGHAQVARKAGQPFFASTCGWPPPEARPEPPILALLEERFAGDGYEAETARDGLARLREWLHDCDETASREAVLELRRAWDRRPSDPAYRAALGVALARGIEVQPPRAHGHNYRPAYGQSNAEREARRLITQVLEEWTSAELGLELAGLALATRDDGTLKTAADALGRLSERLPSAAPVWTARAEVALARHEYDEARETAGMAAQLGDPAGFRALGVTRLLRDEAPGNGAQMYLEGLASAGEGALYRYHEDLAPLLLLEEEQEWADLRGEERTAWLRRQWEWRASTSGRTLAERLAVHFARLETATERYRRLAHRGARPFEAIVWDSLQLRLPFDDRGLIHIRHGEPDDIVRSPSGRMGPGREAWVYYQLAGGRAVFEFRKVTGWADYILAAPVECVPFEYMYGVSGVAGAAAFNRSQAANTAWLEEFIRGVFDYGTRLGTADPELAVHAAFCLTIANRPTRLGAELPYLRLIEASRRREARAEVSEALTTETATPRFENFVQALSSVYTFRGPEGATDVAAFLLLPAGQLTPRPMEGGVAYPLQLSLSIEDNVAQRVQRLDTLIAFGAAAPLREGQYLRTALQMPAQPVSNSTVRIRVVNAYRPDEGQILVGAKQVPAYPRDGLAMSDLVIAEPDPGSWRRGAVAVSPLPGHQVGVEADFRLFYEVYGLEANEGIRTRITVAPDPDPDLLSQLRELLGERRVLELSFTETARPGASGALQVERTITPTVEPGRYVLEVTIERPERGDSVTMRTSILFLERRGG